MLFYTYLFVFWFVPCCALSYYLFLRFGQTRLAVISLIGWSLFFYGWWNPRFLWILVGSICVNFFLSQLLLLARERRPGVATAVLIAGILGNIGLLVHYKYWCLWGGTVSCQSVVLPLAISFFTFQQIEFLIDTWNGKIGAQNFVSYCLFVTFFPHLIAGPITRHSEMMPQFERPPSRIAENIGIGATIFAIGLAKKVFLADAMAVFAETPFAAAAAGQNVSLLPAWLAAIGFTLQLYFDFSGYSDMAIGIGRMFGIKLPLNFNSPLKARNIVEFWQRWHLTLTRYVNTHLYNPVVTWMVRRRPPEQAGTFRDLVGTMVIPTVVVMTIMGIWHGAGMQFVVFGAMHGTLLAGYHVFRWTAKRWAPLDAMRKGMPDWFAVCLTFLLVVVSFVFFKSASIEAAWIILKGMSGAVLAHDIADAAQTGSFIRWLALLVGQDELRPVIINLAYGYFELLYVPVGLALVWLAPNTQQIMSEYMNNRIDNQSADAPEPVRYVIQKIDGSLAKMLVWRPSAYLAILVSAVVVFALMKANYRSAVFLYFQF